MTRVINVESIMFSKYITIERNRLVSKLEEAISKGIATDVLTTRMTLDHFFEGKREEYVARVGLLLKHKETKVVRWSRAVVEKRPKNKTTGCGSPAEKGRHPWGCTKEFSVHNSTKHRV